MDTPLKLARKKRRMTQFDLAIIAGIDVSNISRIERGQQIPFPDVAEKLATALGISELQIFYPFRKFKK